MNIRRLRFGRRGAIAIVALGLGIGGVAVGAAPAMADPTAYCQSVLYQDQVFATNLPNQALECQMQEGPAKAPGNSFVYSGPTDGVLGVNSWKGVMAWLHQSCGYNGPIDGVPGTNTYNAMIRCGNYAVNPLQRPYQPEDGSLSLADWQNWADYVASVFFGD